MSFSTEEYLIESHWYDSPQDTLIHIIAYLFTLLLLFAHFDSMSLSHLINSSITNLSLYLIYCFIHSTYFTNLIAFKKLLMINLLMMELMHFISFCLSCYSFEAQAIHWASKTMLDVIHFSSIQHTPAWPKFYEEVL